MVSPTPPTSWIPAIAPNFHGIPLTTTTISTKRLTQSFQGCCISTTHNSSNSPYPTTNTTSSALPPSDSRVPIAHPAQTTNTSLQPHDAQSPNAPLNAPPHRISPPQIISSSGEPRPATSIVELEAARTEFFDTRVAGRPEMWQALRLVSELVQNGDTESAQAVLDAAGGTCPSGDLWGRRGGCYDEFGERYVVPEWCLGMPSGLEPRADHGNGGDGDAAIGDDGGRGEQALLQDEIRFFTRDGNASKGKDRVPSPPGEKVKGVELKVRVRLSHTARDVVVKLGDQENVEVLVSRLRYAGVISPSSNVRLVHVGHFLNFTKPLPQQGWTPGHVLNMFVFEE
ncbi:hypothetical protein BT63DRAFT_291280 [Microthyrium microscopicum]|uniref:DC-UbP/UBTD2 N-terminal domain-containing protein n=1 Tax=Microthyrium microscopicum TaxID=703497 RepID=A0A6A6U5I2_9PEZI|nr:hypothetical protein BT63DRAFT_291280 [Microthyrium microscopicum]